MLTSVEPPSPSTHSSQLEFSELEMLLKTIIQRSLMAYIVVCKMSNPIIYQSRFMTPSNNDYFQSVSMGMGGNYESNLMFKFHTGNESSQVV